MSAILIDFNSEVEAVGKELESTEAQIVEMSQKKTMLELRKQVLVDLMDKNARLLAAEQRKKRTEQQKASRGSKPAPAKADEKPADQLPNG